MKRIIIFAALLLTTISSFAQSAKAIYVKYSEAEGVSAVYISPAMFRMMGKVPGINLHGEDVNLTPVIQSLSGLYLIDSENHKISASLKEDIDKFVKNGNFELLMEAKDSGETVKLYTSGTKTLVSGFVMFTYEKDDATFIYLDGKMNRDDFDKAISQPKTNKK